MGWNSRRERDFGERNQSDLEIGNIFDPNVNGDIIQAYELIKTVEEAEERKILIPGKHRLIYVTKAFWKHGCGVQFLDSEKYIPFERF